MPELFILTSHQSFSCPRLAGVCAQLLSRVVLLETPWSPGSSVHGISQARIPRSGFPFPSPGDLLNPEVEPVSLALAGTFFTAEPQGKPSFS